jgi:hypothetical protein
MFGDRPPPAGMPVSCDGARSRVTRPCDAPLHPAAAGEAIAESSPSLHL